MNIEIAIFSYTLICVALLIATAFIIPLRYFNNKSLVKKTGDFFELTRNAIEQLSKENELTTEQVVGDLSAKKIRSLNTLISLTQAIEKHRGSYSNEDVNRYCVHLLPIFSKMCSRQMKKTVLYRTYFIYSLSVIFKGIGKIPREIHEHLLINIRTNSLYCRQNVLATYYSFGDPEQVAEVFMILNRTYTGYNSRLLGDGLVEYNGDKRNLAETLLKSYKDYHGYLQLAVLNFIRFTQGGYDDFMLGILKDKDSDNEHIIAAIRYFGKYRDERVRPMLEAYLVDESDERSLECAAVAATSLANYPEGNTFELLKKSLGSSDWYIRLNASISLERLGFNYQEMSDILTGEDRYAREIAYYRLEQYRIRQKQEIVTERQ